VARDVFSEGRGPEGGRTIGDPVLTVDLDGAFAGSSPGLDLLAGEQEPDGGDGPDVMEVGLVAPAGDAGVVEGVGEREEELDVSGGAFQVGAVAVPVLFTPGRVRRPARSSAVPPISGPPASPPARTQSRQDPMVLGRPDSHFGHAAGDPSRRLWDACSGTCAGRPPGTRAVDTSFC
jgi:hypothetical protein